MDRLVYERMNEQEASHWWFVARRDIIRATLNRLMTLPPEADILEAGCGTGGNLGLLQQFGTLDAFEFDPLARQIAGEKSKLDVVFGALPGEIPFGQKLYDLVGLFDVLEHIEDDVATLKELSRRLNPNGRIVVTVPALPWLWSPHDEQHHHFRRYTGKSFSQVVKKAGLQVDYAFYFNSFLLPVVISLRLAKKLMRSETPDDRMPPAWLNTALYKVFSSERHLVGRVKMPVGLSLFAILTNRPDGG